MDERTWSWHHPSTTSVVCDETGEALSLGLYRCGRWAVIEAAGELDVRAVPSLRSFVADAGDCLVFDLRQVTFMDASGLGVLAMSRRSTEQRSGALRLAAPSGQVRRVLAMTRLDRVIPVFDSLDEALADAEPQLAVSGSRPSHDQRGIGRFGGTVASVGE